MPALIRRRAPLLIPLVGLVAAGCPLLMNLPNTVPVEPPRLSFAGVTLVKAPSQRDVAAYYCPEVVSIPFGGAVLLCEGFFGRRPAPDLMNVKFEVKFKIDNPNKVPLPVASLLAGATVFPGTANARVGATCIQLCADASTCPAPEVACSSSSRDLRSMSDFANALPRLLISEGLKIAAGGDPTLPPILPASSTVELSARFVFGPEELLAFLRQLATQSVGELKGGRAPSFAIPYRLEGTAWFDAGSVGRVAIGWGPLDGTFILPVERLYSSL